MELRKLKSDDIFSMCTIIKKIGVDEFKKCFSDSGVIDAIAEGKSSNKVGFDIVFNIVALIIGNLPSAKKDIYEFLASLAGAKPEDIANLGIDEFAEMIAEVFQKEEFGGFFKVVLKFLK